MSSPQSSNTFRTPTTSSSNARTTPTTTPVIPTAFTTSTRTSTSTTLAIPTTSTTLPVPSAPSTPSTSIPTTAPPTVFSSTSSTSSVQTFASTSAIIPSITTPQQTTSTLFLPAPTTSLVPTPSAAGSRASTNGFFSSKGRVAGLFAVIGLLAVAIFFVAITTMVRHRRAKQIDKDVVEAAKEAAAVSHSANFDDYQDSPHTGYSTDSRAHLDHRSAGVAGIGLVGGAAAAMQRARDHRDFTAASAPDDYPAFDDRIPYPAFAGHGLQPHEMYDRSGVHSNPDANAFEAAATPGAFTNRHSSSDRKHISRNSSQGSMGLISEASVYSTASAGESYAAHYRSGYDAAQKPHPPLPPPQQQQQQVLYTTGGLSGGYAQEDPFQSPRLPKPSGPYDANPDDMMGAEHAGDREGHARREGEGRVGFEEEDGDDYKRLPWVLRIANV